MEQTTSSEESSSSTSNSEEEDYTTESSEDEDDGIETAQILGAKLQLPVGLCDRPDVFREFFSPALWNSLSDVHKQHLQTFLPTFPKDDSTEKRRTLKMLFDNRPFRFHSSPLQKFHDHLKAGYFRPEISRMRRIISRAQQKEARHRHTIHRNKLKAEVLESQRKLLAQVRTAPPGTEVRSDRKRANGAAESADYAHHRTKRRCAKILKTIRMQCGGDAGAMSSDDDFNNDVDCALGGRRHIKSIAHVQKDFANLFSTTGESVELEDFVTSNHNPFILNDESYKFMVGDHKRRRYGNGRQEPEFNTKGINLSDVISRTQLPHFKLQPVRDPPAKPKRKKPRAEPHVPQPPPPPPPPPVVIKRESSDSEPEVVVVKQPVPKPQPPPAPPPPPPPPLQERVFVPPPAARPPAEIPAPPPLIQQIPSIAQQYGKVTPMKVEDLAGIDMMELPIDLDNSEVELVAEELVEAPAEMPEQRVELMQDIHSDFFSLIRDVICSTAEHRMNMYALQERLRSWQENPISPLNEWYPLTDNWLSLVPSAITFLCGNSSEQPDDFVPYMEYKLDADAYQWIGAGRDSDALLGSLFRFWLDHRCEKKPPVEPEPPERPASPPPPRSATSWTVRKATQEEVGQFQEQERRRYEQPGRSFTFRCHGYESTVGPLRGLYNAATKPRGHSMLHADRPNSVTILSLVRDATARLPNGEGTRADICELLRSSQYLAPQVADTVLQSVVSGALDRMHTQPDPCVRYDPKRKIWIYLHRGRTEDEFERLHQQLQGAKKKSPAKPRVVKEPTTAAASAPVMATPAAPPPRPKVPRRPSNKAMPGKGTSLLIGKAVPQMPEQQQEQEEREINEALKAIGVAPASPAKQMPPQQSVVKILPPPPPLIKQISAGGGKSPQLVTQQLLQTLAQQQKSIIVQQKDASGEIKIKPQVIQSITAQQLQNIKLVRAAPATSGGDSIPSPIMAVSMGGKKVQQPSLVGMSMAKANQMMRQHHHKVVQVQSPMVYKQRTAVVPGGLKQAAGQGGQGPVVAKVLTNAAGQVISVESLLAHQKQQNSGAPAATLRLAKPGQKVTMATAGHHKVNVVTAAGKLAAAQTKLINAKIVAQTSDGQKIVQPKIVAQQHGQHIRLAAATGGVTTAKGGQMATKPMTLNVATSAAGGNTIRMVNAANLNLTHIGGKPLILAGKNLQGQNVILQQSATGGLVLQQQQQQSTSGTTNYVLSPQLKSQMVLGNMKSAAASGQQGTVLAQQTATQQHVIFSNAGGGHTVSTTTTGATAGGQQRLLLASQGQGGQIVAQQILLPAGFQGTAINLKALQGVKVIPIAQSGGAAKAGGRQVFARVMNPSLALKQQPGGDKPPQGQ